MLSTLPSLLLSKFGHRCPCQRPQVKKYSDSVSISFIWLPLLILTFKDTALFLRSLVINLNDIMKDEFVQCHCRRRCDAFVSLPHTCLDLLSIVRQLFAKVIGSLSIPQWNKFLACLNPLQRHQQNYRTITLEWPWKFPGCPLSVVGDERSVFRTA
jgi:hypothetical protein